MTRADRDDRVRLRVLDQLSGRTLLGRLVPRRPAFTPATVAPGRVLLVGNRTRVLAP